MAKAKYRSKPHPSRKAGVTWNLSARTLDQARKEIEGDEQLRATFFPGQEAPLVGLLEGDKLVDCYNVVVGVWEGVEEPEDR